MPEPPSAVHSRGHVAAIPINDFNSDFCALNHDGIGPLHFLPAIIAIKLNMFCQRGIARLTAQRGVSASVNQSHIHLTQRHQPDRQLRARCRSLPGGGQEHSQRDPNWTELH